MDIYKKAGDTIQVINMDIGDILHYTLHSGEAHQLILKSVSARILVTNLIDSKPYENMEEGGTALHFDCVLNIDGFDFKMERYLCTQESFYEPYVIGGMKLFPDGVSKIFDFIQESHGVCKPKKALRLVIGDAAAAVCPLILYPWCDIPDYFIDIGDTYNGDDCFMGPYGGIDAHGGLDINHKTGSLLYAPFDLDEQFYFESVANGNNNNRWRGIHHFKNGVDFIIQTHHMLELIVEENTPLKGGTPYAKAAGVRLGAHEHSHFVFKIREEDAEEVIDPWILFYEIFSQEKKRNHVFECDFQIPNTVLTGEVFELISDVAADEYHYCISDGRFYHTKKAVHRFAKPGIYRIALCVEKNGEFYTKSKYVIVKGKEKKSTPVIRIQEENNFYIPKNSASLAYGSNDFYAFGTLEICGIFGQNAHIKREIELIDFTETPVIGCPDWIAFLIQENTVFLDMDITGFSVGKHQNQITIMLNDECFVIPLKIEIFAPFAARQVILDEMDAEVFRTPYFFVGTKFYFWNRPRGYGNFLLHTGERKGEKEYVRYTPLLRKGDYKVCFMPQTPYEKNMEIRVKVKHSKGIDIVRVRPYDDLSIGTFSFEDGRESYIELLPEGKDILIDAISFYPL